MWSFNILFMISVYGLANLCGLAASCINPILYGYLNENFRKEYKAFLTKLPWYPADLSVSNDNRIPKNGIEMLPIPAHGQAAHQTPSTVIRSTLNVPKLNRPKYTSCPDIKNQNDEPCRVNDGSFLQIPHNVVVNGNGRIPKTQSNYSIEAPARILKGNPGLEPTLVSRNAGDANDGLVTEREGKIDCHNSVLINVPRIDHVSLLNLSQKSFSEYHKSPKCTIKDRFTSTRSLNNISAYSTCDKSAIKLSNHIEGNMIFKKSMDNVASEACATCNISVRTLSKQTINSVKDDTSSKDAAFESQIDIVQPISDKPYEDSSSIYTCTDSKCLSYCSVCKGCDILEDQFSVCELKIVHIQEPNFLSRSISFPCATNNVNAMASNPTLRDQKVTRYQRNNRKYTISCRNYEINDF